MTTNFPTTKQTIPNPTGVDLLENATAELDHDYQHATANDTIEALQDKVGVDGSAVTTSHDYKLSEVTSADKAVGKTATQTLDNKTIGTGTKITLGSDATGDTYYRDASGNFQRLPKGNTNDILTQGATIPEWTANPATTDASETERGVVEIATQAEVDAGTDLNGTNQLVVEPSKVRAKKYNDYVLATGSANAYVLDVSPSITAYATGQEFTFEANFTNTGSATINVDGLGAVTLKDAEGNTLATNSIKSGGIYKVVYDGTDMLLVSPIQAKRFTMGQTTRAGGAGTGTQAIAHGLGVTPSFIKIFYTQNNGNNNTLVIGSGHATSTSDEECTYALAANDSSISHGQSSGNIIFCTADAGASGAASLSTLDATNITLNWGTNTASEVLIQWEAYK